jgi:hypothetical protein
MCIACKHERNIDCSYRFFFPDEAVLISKAPNRRELALAAKVTLQESLTSIFDKIGSKDKEVAKEVRPPLPPA